MRLPRFTTLQLLLVTALAGLVAGLVTSSWKWGWILVDIDDVGPGESPHQWLSRSELGSAFQQYIYVGGVPIDMRIVPTATFIVGFAVWAAIWGIARKRGRESLAE